MSSKDFPIAKPAEQSSPEDFLGDYLHRLELARVKNIPYNQPICTEKDTPKTHVLVAPKAGILLTVQNEDLGSLASTLKWIEPNEFKMLQKQRLDQWRPKEEVWPLLHGTKLAGFASIIAGYVLNIHTRYFFHLVSQRMATTAVAGGCVPGLMSYYSFTYLVANPILSGEARIKDNKCALCYSLRGALSQMVWGTAFPFVFSVLGGLSVAKIERTYPVPPWTDYRKVANVFKIAFRSMNRPMIAICIIQGLFGAWLGERVFSTDLYVQSKDMTTFEELKTGGLSSSENVSVFSSGS